MSTRLRLAAVGAFLLLGGMASAAPQSAGGVSGNLARPPVQVPWLTPPHNILVVVADDVGVDMINAYGEGAEPARTPTIDALASNGVLFRNAYANPLCSATRATIQTGRWSFRTGVGALVDDYSLPLTEKIIPEVLDAGSGVYQHAAFGKWHLGVQGAGGLAAPNIMGYGHFSGILGGSSDSGYFDYQKVVNGVEVSTNKYMTTDVVDDARDWILQARQPWFVYLAFFAPHNPLHNPPAELTTYDLSHSTPQLQYRAMLEALDTELGRLLDDLRDAGILEDTTVIFLGDNGSPASAILRPFRKSHAKGNLYEGGINVPLIVQSPIVDEPGSECAALVGAVDILATVADVAGVDLVGALEGVACDSLSLVPYLMDSALPGQRGFAFAERFQPNGPPELAILYDRRAIRDKRYKLIVDRLQGYEELYDLSSDPFESQDLLLDGLLPGSPEDSAYAGLKRELLTLLGSS